jgi:glycine/D-amino acid oxidase-like deaminating enzyme
VVALSYWHDSLEPGDTLEPRPALTADGSADVAIVGAGFTGLWTAYSLLRADPTIRVVVLERETAGFGASGRNGGWCVGDYGGPERVVAKAGGPAAVREMAREMQRSVDEVGAVVAETGIDCGFHKGGAFYFAVNDGQLRRVQQHHKELVAHGLGDDWMLLDAAATDAIVHARGVKGGLFTPHAATVHPARLARGLARAVERLGGVVHECTAVRSIERGAVRTDGAIVRADVVVLATEAYTRTIDGHERDVLPLGNQVIATEPIPEATWSSIGLANRELFEYASNMLGYGHRTVDNRIVWGGLSASYRWNMGIPASPTVNPRLARRLRRSLVDLFPELRGIRVTHTWGGVLGVPRDLLPGIGYDRDTGFAWGGGYTGQGVAAANAAGRGLADLIRGVDSELVELPWVGHRSRPWESEPRAWLGVHAVAGAAHVVDRYDRFRRSRGRARRRDRSRA